MHVVLLFCLFCLVAYPVLCFDWSGAGVAWQLLRAFDWLDRCADACAVVLHANGHNVLHMPAPGQRIHSHPWPSRLLARSLVELG